MKKLEGTWRVTRSAWLRRAGSLFHRKAKEQRKLVNSGGLLEASGSRTSYSVRNKRRHIGLNFLFESGLSHQRWHVCLQGLQGGLAYSPRIWLSGCW
eukprot:1160141-Pelagomonas_calceolata.AAC.15